MRLRHRFFEQFSTQTNIKGTYLVKDYQSLINGDTCENCGLVFDVSKHLLNTGHLENNLRHYMINKLYPCLTENEYAIKKLLE